MDTQPRTVDPLAAVLVLLDAGDALAAAVRLAADADGRRRLVGRASGAPLPGALADAADDWQTAADDAGLTLRALAAALRLPAPLAAAPALDLAA